jgi:hypothetical protein
MNFLIAAGGTGQEVAAAVMRLCYLTGRPFPEIEVFDTDIGSADSSSGQQTRTQVLTGLHDTLLGLGALDHSILTQHIPAEIPGSDRRAQRVAACFGRHGTLSPDDQALLDLLLDTTQQNTNVDDGFHGHPALGSLVFSNAIENDASKDMFERIAKAAETTEGARVVLVGSLTGGVGTAVVPVLARKLNEIRSEGHKRRNLRILSLFQLSWFRLAKFVEETGSNEPDVVPAMLDRNACCLIRTYLDRVGAGGADHDPGDIDRAFFVGLPQPVERVSQGGSRQLETYHYVNLISAVMVANLLTQAGEFSMVDESRNERFFAPVVSCRTPSDVLRGDSSATRLHMGDRHLTIEQIARVARVMVAATRTLEFETDNISPSLAHSAIVANCLKSLSPSASTEFQKKLQQWHAFHRELLVWLRRTIESTAGGKRADTLNIFVPDAANGFYDEGAPSVLEALHVNPVLAFQAPDRRVLSRLSLATDAELKSGANAAYQIVRSARTSAVSRVC